MGYFIVMADYGYHPSFLFDTGDSWSNFYGIKGYLVLTSPMTTAKRGTIKSGEPGYPNKETLRLVGGNNGMFFEELDYKGCLFSDSGKTDFDGKTQKAGCSYSASTTYDAPLYDDDAQPIKASNGAQVTFGALLEAKSSCTATQPDDPIRDAFYPNGAPDDLPAEHKGCLMKAGWPTGFPCYFDFMHRKFALITAQTAYFTSIVVVQWADIIICKTRTLSVVEQKMKNGMLNFGLFSETALGCFLCYVPAINALGTCPIFVTHWFAPMPFSMIISCMMSCARVSSVVTTPFLLSEPHKRRKNWMPVTWLQSTPQPSPLDAGCAAIPTGKALSQEIGLLYH